MAKYARSYSRKNQTRLEDAGYTYAGYESDKDKAMDRARDLRANGFHARIVLQLSSGRIYTRSGYVIMKREKTSSAGPRVILERVSP